MTSVTLREISAFITKGATPTTYGFKWEMAGVPFLRSECVAEKGLDMRKSMFISPKADELLRRSQVRDGDILMTITGYVGRVIRLAGVGSANINQHIARIRVKDPRFDPGYVYHYLAQRTMRNYYETIVTGQAYPQISLAQVRATSIPVVSLAEQRHIASALDDVDDQIATLERLAAKKQAIKQGMMQQLLTGITRLSGLSTTQTVTTEAGELPTDWSLQTLERLVDQTRPIRYGIVQPGKYDRNGRYMIRGQDYSEAKGWADPTEVFRVSDHVERKYRNARLRSGDLIMTIVGYAGHVEIVPARFDGANITQTTARISIDPERALPEFCRYVLQSSVGQRQVERYLKGAAQPGLNIGDVEKFLVCLPSMDEQAAIANVLTDSDADIDALRGRLTKARAIKTGMMQELLTGRTLLPVEAAS